MDRNKKQNPDRIWSELHAYESEVFGYIKRSVGSADLAQDLCQDVYLQALQKLDELDPQRSLKNWLITVARNRVINYYLKNKRRQFEQLTEDTLQTEIETGNFNAAFQSSLAGLPEKQKEIFILRELDGFSYQELARKLNITEAAATSLLKRARLNFSKSYLLYFLPDWFNENARYLEVQDIMRFINSFEPPENLLEQIEQKSQRYFAAIKDGWETIRCKFFSKRKLEEIFTYLGGQKNKSILDLGSGAGFVAVNCALRGNRVTGIEINTAMTAQLKQIKQNLKLPDIYLIRGNINHLPVKQNCFDQVFITLVLHHVAHPAGLIRQAAAALNIGGKMVIVDFKRHTNKESADIMRDLWLGFDPAVIRKWAGKSKLKEIRFHSWDTKEKISVFYQIFEKLK